MNFFLSKIFLFGTICSFKLLCSHRKFVSGLDEESRICDDPISTLGSDLILSDVDQIGATFNGNRRTALANLAAVQLGI
jgi:hypothetical protein